MANRQKPDHDDRPASTDDGERDEEFCEDIDTPDIALQVLSPDEAARWRRWSAEADAELLAQLDRAIAEQARD